MDGHEGKEACREAWALCGEKRYAEALARLDDPAFGEADTQDALYLRGLCLLGESRFIEARAVCERLTQQFGEEACHDLKARLSAHEMRAAQVLPVPDAERPARRRWGWWIGLFGAVVVVAALVWFAVGGRPEPVCEEPGEEAVLESAPPLPTSAAVPAEQTPHPVEAVAESSAAAESVASPTVAPVPESTLGDAGRLEAEESPGGDLGALVRRLGDESARDRTLATLHERVCVRDLDVLHGALASMESGAGRAAVVGLIGEIGSSRSVETLKRVLLEDQAAEVRAEATRAIGSIEMEEALDALAHALEQDADPMVRRRAAWALCRALGSRAMPPIQAAVEREDDPQAKVVLQWMLDGLQSATHVPNVAFGDLLYGAVEGTLFVCYVPKTYTPSWTNTMLVAVHGMTEDAEHYAMMCRDDAEKYGVIVVAPYFNPATYPELEALDGGLGGVRADQRLLQILKAISDRTNADPERFWLFGHDRGGEFTSSFTLAHSDRVLRAAVCGADHHVMPDEDVAFPRGLAVSERHASLGSLDYGALVKTPLAVVVGTKDLARRSAAAQRFTEAASSYARERGIECNVKFMPVPGGGHSGESNYGTAVRFLLAGQRPARRGVEPKPKETPAEAAAPEEAAPPQAAPDETEGQQVPEEAVGEESTIDGEEAPEESTGVEEEFLDEEPVLDEESAAVEEELVDEEPVLDEESEAVEEELVDEEPVSDEGPAALGEEFVDDAPLSDEELIEADEEWVAEGGAPDEEAESDDSRRSRTDRYRRRRR
ncbi:MAG TPA: HEAT repeat domain-containing protein [Candidatus Hydrogenedentes bacterium]|nr:HEAT repeat domain-containing protein [Candidatus Hydrogenedentota bacterium]HPG69546.1 HEAT repeat domain-containing protein [Candidatus Hydrogenedentota bacterium]